MTQFARMTISPERAEELLGSLPFRRRVRQGKVNEFAGAMARHEWRLNGETLKLDSQGRVLDGMHRLLAVKQYGKPVMFDVATGVDPDALPTIDIGTVRSATDTLQALGKSKLNPSVEAGALRLLFHYLRGQKWMSANSSGASMVQILDLADEHPGLYDHVTNALRVRPKVKLPSSVILVAMYITSLTGTEDSHRKFWDGVETGADLSLGDPRLAVRDLHSKMKQRSRRALGASTGIYQLSMLVKGWNAFLDGRDLGRLYAHPREDVMVYPRGWSHVVQQPAPGTDPGAGD